MCKKINRHPVECGPLCPSFLSKCYISATYKGFKKILKNVAPCEFTYIYYQRKNILHDGGTKK